MAELGVVVSAVSVTVLVAEFLRHRRQKYPLYGWMGLVALACAELLMFRGIGSVATYFTPIAWSAYLLAADAAVYSTSGRSLLRNAPREFFRMALLSVPLWLIFEGYNLRLQNWTYIGVPKEFFAAALGYGWSFATITPAILETAELIESLGWFSRARPLRFSLRAKRAMLAGGLLCLVVPLIVPRRIGSYLMAPVWIGFALLLDPINRQLGLPSLLGEFELGRRSRLYSLFISGWACGWLWEFWNYWAAAKWHYIFPILPQTKIFEMPAPGYLGFLPFAVECYVMYVTASWLLGWQRSEKI